MPLTYQHKSWLLERLSCKDEWIIESTPVLLMEDAHTKHPLRNTVNTSVLSLRFDDAPAGMAAWEMINGAKLLLAYDLGIEPNLKVVNIRRRAEGLTQVTPQNFFLPWTLTSEFEGYSIDSPRNFSIEPLQDADGKIIGIEIRTRGSIRERILNQVNFWRSANPATIRLSRAPDAKALVNALQNASHEGGWLALRLMTDQQGACVKAARRTLGRNLGLETGDYTAFDDAPDHVLIGCRADKFNVTSTAFIASLDLFHSIRNGVNPGETHHNVLRHALRHGADLKYLDPEAVENGKTFADVMMQYQAYEFIIALQELQGTQREPKPYEPKI